jgi:glutamate racemase
MKIAFFDSGIGGISVLKEAVKLMPDEKYIYYADSENAPYGTKPKEEVREYIFRAFDFLEKQNIKAAVVACNTATSIAIDDLRDMYKFPVIGMEPAVKPAAANSKGKRVLLLATPLTLKEEKLLKLMKHLDIIDKVSLKPAPELVRFGEQFVFDGKEVEDYIISLFDGVEMEAFGAVVLGCTHFTFFEKVFKRLIPESVELIDGNSGTIRHLMNSLHIKKEINSQKPEVEYYLSGKPVVDKELIKKYNELAGI